MEWIIIVGIVVAMYVVIYKYERKMEKLEKQIEENKTRIEENQDKIDKNHKRLNKHKNHIDKMWVTLPKDENKSK